VATHPGAFPLINGHAWGGQNAPNLGVFPRTHRYNPEISPKHIKIQFLRNNIFVNSSGWTYTGV